MNLKGKKLLIIGGAAQHCKVVEAAKNMGIITYVTDYLPPESAPAKQIADHYAMINITDVDSLELYCKQNKIDGVISVCLDACQIPYQRLCEKLKFPCFGTKEQFELLTNKTQFKKICKKYNVDTIPEFDITSFDSKKKCDCEVEFPVLIKPAISRGSRGQNICNSYEEALAAIHIATMESSNGEVVIEKYMDGKKDFTVSYLFVNGEAFLVRTADRYDGDKEEHMEKVCVAAFSPSRYLDLFLENVSVPLINMLKGIGIRTAPVFFQGFVDGNTIRFYDPGLRFAGGEHERMYKHIYGIDLMTYLIEFALSGDTTSFNPNIIDKEARLLNQCAVNLDPTVRGGVIGRIDGEDAIRNKEYVISMFPRHFVGDTVPNSCDVNQRYAEIDIIASTVNEMKNNIREIQNTLKICDIYGNDMIFSNFKVDKLD